MKTGTSSLKTELRRANKIFNQWVAVNAPGLAQKQRYRVPSVLGNPEYKDSESENEMQALITSLTSSFIGRQHQSKELVYFYIPYLYDDDLDDDDIVLREDFTAESADNLKNIRSILKASSRVSLSDIQAFNQLLTKLDAFLVISDPLNRVNQFAYAEFEKWGKIACKLLENKTLNGPNTRAALQKTRTTLLILYSHLANYAAQNDNDLINALAESLLAMTEALIQESSDVKLQDAIRILNLCTWSRLAWQRGDIEEADRHLAAALRFAIYVPNLIWELNDATKAVKATHPALALKYSQAILTLTDKVDQAILRKDQKLSAAIAHATQNILDILSKTFKKTFPKARVKIIGKAEGLFIYVPFSKLDSEPRSGELLHTLGVDITIHEVFDHHRTLEGKVHTGIKFKTTLMDPSVIIPRLENYKIAMELAALASNQPARPDKHSKSRPGSSRPVSQSKTKGKNANLHKPRKSSPPSASPSFASSTSAGSSSVSAGATDSSSSASTTSAMSFSSSLSLPPPSGTPPQEFVDKSESKTRSRRASDTMSVSANAVAIPASFVSHTPWPKAGQYGFTVCTNLPVTPIYTTAEAQRLGKTKLFAVWEGVPEFNKDRDKDIIDHFRSMLQPLEGMIIVRKRGQAGAKLESVPNERAEDWGNCFLRLKALGQYGHCRVFANHKQKITVDNQNGKKEHRYLFSFGVARYK